jgi:PmbA protein
MQKITSTKTPLQGFSYSRAKFEELVDNALAHAKKLGATDAGAEASEGCGLSVSARLGKLENVERNRDKSLGVTVYIGKKRGNASTSDFSAKAIEQTVQAAYDIARFTAEDDMAGLPDQRDVATEQRDLDLFHPWSVNSEQALELALLCEGAAMGTSKKITNSEGAGISAQQSHFVAGHLRGGQLGFRGGYAAAFAVGRAHCRQRCQHAARCLVQLGPQCLQLGQPRGRRPLRRRARAQPLEFAQSAHGAMPRVV